MIAIAAAAFLVLELAVGPADRRARHGAELTEITIDSDAVGRELPTEVVVPEGAGDGPPRPLLVFLHGRGAAGERSNLDEEMYEALAAQGKRAPVVAFPSGGIDSYWHDRADGDWERYLIEEVIPRVVEDFPADPNRVAIGGISMGGFGALDVARLNPDRFCAVGGHSAALWRSGGETAPGAFDDAEDFERHDVIGSVAASPATLGSQPIWLDAGDEDPFIPGIEALASELRAGGANLSFRIWPGEHNGDYWLSHWDEYMRFYARTLSGCG